MIGVVAVDDLRPPGGGAAELDRRLHRLGAGIAEEQLVEPRHPRRQPLGEQPGEQRDIELHHAGEFAVQHLFEGGDHRRVVAAHGEHAETAEQVEIAVAVAVEQIGALGADVIGIEPDGLEHAQKLGIEMPVEQRELLGPTFGNELLKIKGHGFLDVGVGSVARGLEREPRRPMGAIDNAPAIPRVKQLSSRFLRFADGDRPPLSSSPNRPAFRRRQWIPS